MSKKPISFYCWKSICFDTNFRTSNFVMPFISSYTPYISSISVAIGGKGKHIHINILAVGKQIRVELFSPPYLHFSTEFRNRIFSGICQTKCFVSLIWNYI